MSPGRFAYAFYATDDTYAAAVIVFAHLLRLRGVGEGIDLVVLHVGVSAELVDRMRAMGLLTRAVERMRYSRHRYYRDCFVKLRVFALEDYQRVVYVDADAVPLAPLDDLFSFPFDGPLAAPRADWLPQPFWGSHLMVVRPSADAWQRVERLLPGAARRRHFDMDIVNDAFAGAIATLPARTVRLNSEWEDMTRPEAERRSTAGLDAVVVHFTALGKPWSHDPARVRRMRPKAHPFFYELWETWWKARAEVGLS